MCVTKTKSPNVVNKERRDRPKTAAMGRLRPERVGSSLCRPVKTDTSTHTGSRKHGFHKILNITRLGFHLKKKKSQSGKQHQVAGLISSEIPRCLFPSMPPKGTSAVACSTLRGSPRHHLGGQRQASHGSEGPSWEETCRQLWCTRDCH